MPTAGAIVFDWDLLGGEKEATYPGRGAGPDSPPSGNGSAILSPSFLRQKSRQAGLLTHEAEEAWDGLAPLGAAEKLEAHLRNSFAAERGRSETFREGEEAELLHDDLPRQEGRVEAGDAGRHRIAVHVDGAAAAVTHTVAAGQRAPDDGLGDLDAEEPQALRLLTRGEPRLGLCPVALGGGDDAEEATGERPVAVDCAPR